MNAADLLSTLDHWGFSLARVLLTVLWQSSIVFGAVAALSWLLRKRRAGVRHGLWLAALLVAPVLPLLTMAVSQAGAPQAPVSVLPTYTEPAPFPALAFEPAPAPAIPPDLSGSEMLAPEVHVSVWSYPWALLLTGYALGLALFVGWVALGRIRIGQWIRSAFPVTDGCVLAAFKAAREKLRVTRDFPVLETDRIPAPVTAGLLRPVVLLPRGLAEGLSPVDIQSIAVHELAHIARRDPFILSVIALVRAALFFHPLVWLACRQVSLLAEQAADDAVLDATGEPVAYARMLARLAENLRRRALTTELAAGIMLSKSAFLRRVEAILSDRRDQLRRLSRRALALTVLAALLSLFLASALPLSEKQSPQPKEQKAAEPGETMEGARPRAPSETREQFEQWEEEHAGVELSFQLYEFPGGLAKDIAQRLNFAPEEGRQGTAPLTGTQLKELVAALEAHPEAELRVPARKMVIYDQAKAYLGLQSHQDYVKDVRQVVVEGEERTEPVVATLLLGPSFVARPTMSPDKRSVVLELFASDSRLERFQTWEKLGVKIEEPVLESTRLQVRLKIPSGGAAALRGLRLQGHDLLLLVSATIVDLPLDTGDGALRKELRQPVTFNFTDASLDEVVGFLQGIGGLAIVLDPQVQARQGPLRITLALKNVRLEDALRWLLDMLDLEWTVRYGYVYFMRPAPELVLEQIPDVPVVSLAQLKGKTVLLAFVSINSEPCVKVLHDLKALQQKQGADKLGVIAVHDRTAKPEDIDQFRKDHSIPFPIVRVPDASHDGWDSETFRAYGITARPTVVLIDGEGRVTSLREGSVLISPKKPEPSPAAAGGGPGPAAASDPTVRAPLKAAEQALRDKLARHVTFSFADAPLEVVVDFLRQATDANIVVDQRVLTAAGPGGKRVTLTRTDIPVEDALGLIVKAVELDWTLYKGVLFISEEGRLKDLQKREQWLPEVMPESEATTPENEATRPKLDRAVTLSFTDIPLDAVVDFFRMAAGVNIVLDQRVLAAAGARDKRVTLTLTDVPLKAALDITLTMLDLHWTVRRGAIFISDLDGVLPEPTLTVYDIEDLIGTVPASLGDKVMLDNRGAKADLGELAHQPLTAEALVQLIRKEVFPETWQSKRTSTEVRGGRLLVVSPAQVQKQIIRLLDALRGCVGNLKQIGLAIFMYRADHSDALPRSLDELAGGGFIGDRAILSCPVSKTRYEYVTGIDWQETNPTFVVAYDAAGVHEGRRNALFLDGHVETLSEEGFRACLERTQAALLKQQQEARPAVIAEVGKPAPALVLDQGAGVTLAQFKGRPVVVAFVSIYSRPCVKVLDDLKALQTEKGADKLAVIAVHDRTATPEEIEQFRKDHSIPFPIVRVPDAPRDGWDSATFRAYGVESLPAVVRIDPEGKVVSMDIEKAPERPTDKEAVVSEAPTAIEAIEGTVRYAATGEPAAGATVTLETFRSGEATSTSDQAGRFSLRVPERLSFPYTVYAHSSEATPVWEGIAFLEKSLRPGERASVVDVTLRKSLAARQEEWLSRPGQPRTGKCWIAVLDDCDPDFKGKNEYEDTVTVYDTEGVERSRFVGLNTCETVGGNHAIAWNTLDRSLSVVELVGHRLLKFDEHVRLVWGKDELEASALAVDPKTGDVWVLTSEGTISGAQVLVLDARGQVVHQWDSGALDVAYSEHDDCFWLAGKKVVKLSRGGEVLFATPAEFAWVAVSIAVNDLDGSAWVAERWHPQVAGSRDRLFVFERDGRVRREVDLEYRSVMSVAVDSERQCVWVATFQGVLKFSLTGELLVDVPIAGFSLAVEPDTGYVWVGSRSGLYRLDGQGNLVWSKATPANSQKWLSATAR